LIVSSPANPLPPLCRCLICGFESRWINPFPPLPVMTGQARPKWKPPIADRMFRFVRF
jgi:hypothetical protein